MITKFTEPVFLFGLSALVGIAAVPLSVCSAETANSSNQQPLLSGFADSIPLPSGPALLAVDTTRVDSSLNGAAMAPFHGFSLASGSSIESIESVLRDILATTNDGADPLEFFIASKWGWRDDDDDFDDDDFDDDDFDDDFDDDKFHDDREDKIPEPTTAVLALMVSFGIGLSRISRRTSTSKTN